MLACFIQVYVFFRRTIALVEPLVLRWPAQILAAAATIPCLWVFYLFTGAQVSAGRAALMAALGMAAVLACRRTDSLNVVAFAALAMMVAEPGILFSISFQLSCAAVVSLILASRRCGRLLRPPENAGAGRRILGWSGGLLVASLAAGMLTNDRARTPPMELPPEAACWFAARQSRFPK